MFIGLIPTLIAAHLAVGGFAMSWKHIPEIPAGRRAQYYLLQDDGGYRFGYDTGTGTSAEVSSDPANEVKGGYSFGSPSGVFSLKYTAGVAGYVPIIESSGISAQDYGTEVVSAGEEAVDNAHSTFTYSGSEGGEQVASQDGAAAEKTAEVSSSDESSAAAVEGASEGAESSAGGAAADAASGAVEEPQPPAQEAAPPPPPPPATSSDAEASAASQFGTYSFSYDAGDHSREESSDARGNVRGRYSFRSKGDSVMRTVEYEAGAGTGFVARGSHLPKAPAIVSQAAYVGTGSPGPRVVPSVSRSGDGSYSFSYDAGDHSREETADAAGNVRGSFSFVAKGDGTRRKVEYEAGAKSGFIARGQHIGSRIASQAATVAAQTQTVSADAGATVPSGDAAYSFSYDAGDHSREESSDSSGNVRGSYSFVSRGDGLRRRVEYRAGSASGFVATGDHLPKPELSYTRTAQASAADSAGGSSYDFSYDAGDHSRQESSDASGNVRGSYSFVTKDDGVRRRVEYSAGAATGFTARGDHLPKATAMEAEASSQVEASAQPGTYSFSYDAGDHSREESLDSAGKVTGSFSYKDGDVSRRVEYEAGPKTGFVARADHLPTPVEAPVVEQAQAEGSVTEADAPVTTSNEQSSDASANLDNNAVVSGDAVAGAEAYLLATPIPIVYTNDASAYQTQFDPIIETYLPPNEHNKYGYIYDTRH